MTEAKRESERVPMHGEVTGEVTVFMPMHIVNMSERGAQIETSFPLHLDSLHEFRLSLGDRSVVVKGRIVHCQIGELHQGAIRYRTGLEFIEPPEHARAAIREFVIAQTAARLAPPVIDAELADEL